MFAMWSNRFRSSAFAGSRRHECCARKFESFTSGDPSVRFRQPAVKPWSRSMGVTEMVRFAGDLAMGVFSGARHVRVDCIFSWVVSSGGGVSFADVEGNVGSITFLLWAFGIEVYHLAVWNGLCCFNLAPHASLHRALA